MVELMEVIGFTDVNANGEMAEKPENTAFVPLVKWI